MFSIVGPDESTASQTKAHRLNQSQSGNKAVGTCAACPRKMVAEAGA